MKNIVIFLSVFVCGFICACAKQSASVDKIIDIGSGFEPFYVYDDFGTQNNHYIATGWMGDVADLKIDMVCTSIKYRGNYCIKMVYTPNQKSIKQWVGVYWQNPANNWGDKKGGYNLTGAKKLSFWARGANGGEKISEFKVGGITGEYPDSDSQSMGPVELTKEWQQYTLDLEGKDLSYIIGGFAFSASKDDNPNGFVIYFDDIIFE